MPVNAVSTDWRRLTRLDREALDTITIKMQERFSALTLLEIEEAILDAFGIHVRIATKGRDMGVITLAFADIGVPEDSARARHVRAPKMELLPKETMDRISAAFMRSRETLARFGVKLVTRSLVWVPLAEWQACREAITDIRAEAAEIVRNELLDRYTELREGWREKALEKAAESYRSLADAGVEITTDRETFTTRYIARVLDAFPSYGQIQNGIDLFYETSRPSPGDLVEAVIGFRDAYFAEKARALDLEAAKKHEQTERRRMMQERAEIWRAQAEQASALDEMRRSAGSEILRGALPVGSGLSNLTPGASRKLKNEIERWLSSTGSLISTQELDDQMRRVLYELDQPARKRSQRLIRSLLSQLSEELTRTGQPNPLYTMVGAGVLDLQEVIGS